jgi:hypothetical protein
MREKNDAPNQDMDINPAAHGDTSNSSDDDNDFNISRLEIVFFKACSAAI